MTTNKWKYIAGAIIPILIGWGLTHTLIVSNRARTNLEVSKFPKGKQGAIEQSYALLDALRANDWDYRLVPDHLKRLADERPPSNPRMLRRTSFIFQPRYQDVYSELAFYSPTFIRRRLTIVPGSEGTMAETGFYILGFKYGTVTTCEPSEVHIIPYMENGEQIGLPIFPGMDEYAEAKASKSKQKSAKP